MPLQSQPAGLLARQRIETLAQSGVVTAAAPIEPGQIQPASLDLRLGGEQSREEQMSPLKLSYLII